MSIDSDTNKTGLNALARAHAILGLLPLVLKNVKAHVGSPSWELARTIALLEQQMVDTDQLALETLYTAMGSK
jgi:hypothetical protein